jgi:hypothetical protein
VKVPIFEIIFFMAGILAATTATRGVELACRGTASSMGSRRPAGAEQGHLGMSAASDRLRCQQ